MVEPISSETNITSQPKSERGYIWIMAVVIGVVLAAIGGGVWYYVDHESPEKNFERGAEYFKKENYEKSAKYFRKAANKGFAPAQLSLGVYYTHGKGVPLDYAEAVKWFRKAAEQGLPFAQFALGNCYAKGQGVPLDYEEAIKWYRKAAENGDEDAIDLLETLKKSP